MRSFWKSQLQIYLVFVLALFCKDKWMTQEWMFLLLWLLRLMEVASLTMLKPLKSSTKMEKLLGLCFVTLKLERHGKLRLRWAYKLNRRHEMSKVSFIIYYYLRLWLVLLDHTQVDKSFIFFFFLKLERTLT